MQLSHLTCSRGNWVNADVHTGTDMYYNKYKSNKVKSQDTSQNL